MVSTICLGLAIIGAPAPSANQAKLVSLSAARGAFQKQYRSPKRKSLQIVENLGTTGLGNPLRDWYFPAGSASYRIWIVTYQACELTDSRGRSRLYPTTGKLVFQSRHGSYTTTDWVLPLVYIGSGRHATGAVANLVAQHGFRIKSGITAVQQKLLSERRAYVGFAEETGLGSDIFIWFVRSDGRAAPGFYDCERGSGGNDARMDIEMLDSPPITPNEAQMMGIHLRALWHGPGTFTATYVIGRHP